MIAKASKTNTTDVVYIPFGMDLSSLAEVCSGAFVVRPGKKAAGSVAVDLLAF